MAQKIGLNVGSGQRPFKTVHSHDCSQVVRFAANMPGLPDECTGNCVHWVNVDSQAKWRPDYVCDGMDLPFENESFDFVVLHHVLEHFGCGEGAGLIREAYRVLKPGGSLLVFVPDLSALAFGWLQGKISTQIYMTNIYGAYMGSEDDRHKWGFDEESLREFLSREPHETTWGWIGKPKTFPVGADIAHDWWILEMECVK